MGKLSAGILLYRRMNKHLEILLVHPGGPFFAKKDEGAWSLPKGEFNEGDDPLAAAKREFHEETGTEINGEFIELKPVKLKSGKKVFAWAVEGELDASEIRSNSFELEWPPRSGKFKVYPEVDKAEWFDYPTAKLKINVGQVPLIEELERNLESN